MHLNLTGNVDVVKYGYSDYGIEFDASSSFSLSNGTGFGRNVIIFGLEKISVHADKEKKDIQVLGKGPTNRLDDTTITPEAQCFINFLINYFIN